jgi:hypothetical protein
MDSVRTQSGMLAMITSQTDEITRDIQVRDESQINTKYEYIFCKFEIRFSKQ